MEEYYSLNREIFAEETALNMLEPLGFDVFLLPDNSFKLSKLEKQPLNSPVVQGSLENIYCNAKWRAQHYNKDKALFRKVLGLRFNAEGKPTMSEKFKSVLTDWRLEIQEPYGDMILSVRSGDPFEQTQYINSKNVDEIAKDTIQEMMDLGYVVKLPIEEA